jgi:hypothetical protein
MMGGILSPCLIYAATSDVGYDGFQTKNNFSAHAITHLSIKMGEFSPAHPRDP